MAEYQQPVGDFSQASNRVEELLEYPGCRPESSFITDGDTVTPLPGEYDAFAEAADARLSEAGLPLIADRVPVLAYGANASPHRLQAKMAKFGADFQPLMQTVPHCVAAVPNVLAVWHGQPGQTGSAFAELYNGRDADGAILKAHVAFMTIEQMAAIHVSEGVTYSAYSQPVTLGEQSPTTTDVVAYVALDSKVLLKDGHPVLVKGIRNDSSLPALTAEEAVGFMLQTSGEPEDVAAFVAAGITMSLQAKKRRQSAIGDSLSTAGANRQFRFSDSVDPALLGRANFVDLPRGGKKSVQLPEMVLAAIRPSAGVLADKIDQLRQKHSEESPDQLRARAQRLIDPARMVSRRAHDELKTKLELVK